MPVLAAIVGALIWMHVVSTTRDEAVDIWTNRSILSLHQVVICDWFAHQRVLAATLLLGQIAAGLQLTHIGQLIWLGKIPAELQLTAGLLSFVI